MSIILDKAILEADSEFDVSEMHNIAGANGDGELIDLVDGMTDHMLETQPDYTEEDIDDDVKEIVDEEV